MRGRDQTAGRARPRGRGRVPRRVGVPAFAAVGAMVLGVCLASTASAIANGDPVPQGRYRFSVKLTMTDIPRPDGSHYDSACSGALVSPRWVVTAGHCMHDVNRNPVSGPVPYPTTATLGVSDLSDPHAIVVDVVRSVQSPINDITLVELAHPVRGIAPLRLAHDAPRVGQVLRITGWGSLGDVSPTPATHLQTGQVSVVSVTGTTVGVVGYAPAPDTSACLYDSGAPYFVEIPHQGPRLVSVESSGPACPHTDTETTSRVDPLLSWIRTTVDGGRAAGHDGAAT